MPARTEVVVVGAGPAGCVAALLLARLGARVALIADTATADGRPPAGEALPPAARPAFARVGLTAVLDDPAHRSMPGSVAAWGTPEPVTVDHLRSPLGDGIQLDRAAFDRWLRTAAEEAGATLVRVPRGAWGGLWPGADAGRGRRRRVTVDASGRVAAVARAAGACLERADRLVAIVGVLGSPGDPRGPDALLDRRITVAATPVGWWSTMALPDGRRIATFHTDTDLPAAALRAHPDRWWEALVGVPLVGRLARAEGCTRPQRLHVLAADSRRLRVAATRPPDAPGLVAVGDAEMAFDPLSSFGIVGAISSAEEALPVIAGWLDGDAAGARAEALREVAREHRWGRYRARLAAAYADEKRWPDEAFWARRQGAPPV